MALPVAQKIETPKRWRAWDTSGNNNHGQIYSGRGLEFDGVGDRITFTEQSYADNTPWTIACWAYFDSLSATEFITGEDGNTRPHIGVTGAGVPVFRANYGTGESANSHFEFGTQGLEDKTWYRIVWTATGASSTINCYLNGVLTGSINSGTTSNSGSGTLAALTGGGSNFNWNNIGSPYESGGNRGHGVDGKLSDFQSWNATWTAEDAAFDYANPEQLALNRGGTSLTESNLKLWYPMNDGHRGQQSYVLDASNTGLGDEMIVNGDFSDDSVPSTWNGSSQVNLGSGWLAQGTHNNTNKWTIVNGQLKHVLADTDSYIKSTVAIVVGTTYKVTVDIVEYSSGVLSLYHNGASRGTASSVGTHEFYFTATSTAWILDSTGTCDFTIDNVSIKPVNNKNHATTVFYGDEMIADSKNQAFTGTPNWAVHDPQGGSSASVSVVGGKLQVVTTTDAEIEGAILALDDGSGTDYITTPVVGRTYRFSASLDSTSGDTTPTIIVSFGGGTASNAISTTEAVHNFDIVAANTTGDLLVYTDSSTAATFTIENASVKEEGTATGWTDADQQLDIPQTALQSYNQLAWFDGNEDRITVTQFDFTTGQTMNMWLFSNDSSPYRSIFGNNTTENYMRFKNGDEAGAFEFEPDNNTVYNLDVGSTVLPEGEWYMLTFVWNADRTMDAYKNGELIGSSSATEDTTDGKTMKVARFGHGYSSGDDVDFNGAMTEISHYTDLLTQAEINDLYNDGKAKDAREASGNGGLSGYWKNNGLATWTDLANPGTNDGAVSNLIETMVQHAGVDGSRDCQGFLMNRQKDTNALNLPDMGDIAAHVVSENNAYVDLKDSPLGTDYIGSGNHKPFSISLWIKPRRTYSNNKHTAFWLGDSDTSWVSIGIENGTSGKHGITLGADMDNYIRPTYADAINTNEWSHIVLCCDSGQHSGSNSQHGDTGEPMVDSSASFDVDDLIDALIMNCTDDSGGGSWGKITDNTATNIVSKGIDDGTLETGTAGLSQDDGTDGEWDTNDSYNIVKLYVNGSAVIPSVNNDPGMDVGTDNDNRYYVGTDDTANRQFVGKVDEIMVYDKWLTEAEVNRNYKAGKRSHK